MTLAAEITKLETELASARAEIDAVGKKNAVLEFENDTVKKALALANADRDALLRRSEAIKALLDQCAAALTHGLRQYAASERQIDDQQRAAGTLESGIASIVHRRGNGALHTDGETQTEH